MNLSLIIPCYNEEKIISKTVYKLQNILNKNYELILIDDFSKDKTFNELIKCKNKFKNIKVFKNKKKGLGSAISLGIERSKKKYVAIFMADLSDDIRDLKKYYKLISSSNLDAVFGSRFILGSNVYGYPIVKKILNRIFNNFVKLLFISKYNDFTNAFKIYNRNTLIKLKPYVSENFNIFLELPLKIVSRNYKYKIIPIKWRNRKQGYSKFDIKELGSKYLFTLIYCYFEKILINKNKST